MAYNNSLYEDNTALGLLFCPPHDLVSLNHLINPNQKNFYHKVKYVIKRVLLMVQIAE